jgi:hypothetical protein
MASRPTTAIEAAELLEALRLEALRRVEKRGDR